MAAGAIIMMMGSAKTQQITNTKPAMDSDTAGAILILWVVCVIMAVILIYFGREK